MTPRSRWLAAVAPAVLLASPRAAAAQGANDQSSRWYWGAQGGAYWYQTNVQPYYFDPILGAHWLITAKRTALYVAYEQAWFLVDARAAVSDPAAGSCSIGTACRNVTFSDVRRLMFGVLAFPMDKRIEPYAGGGFALMQVLNPIVDCSSCITQSEAFQAQSRAEDAASKAFFWMMGGVQLTRGKLALFGHYVVTSPAHGFLIKGPTHSFQGGLRYAFGTAKETLSGRN